MQQEISRHAARGGQAESTSTPRSLQRWCSAVCRNPRRKTSPALLCAPDALRTCFLVWLYRKQAGSHCSNPTAPRPSNPKAPRPSNHKAPRPSNPKAPRTYSPKAPRPLNHKAPKPTSWRLAPRGTSGTTFSPALKICMEKPRSTEGRPSTRS